MLKDLFLDKIRKEIKYKILEEYKIISNSLDSDDKRRISSILSKNEFSIEDINDLLIDFFSDEFDRDELINLVNNDVLIDNYIMYCIYSYLVSNGNNKVIELVVSRLGYLYTFNDVKIIDRYLKSCKFKDNELVFSLLDKIYGFEQSKDNSLFKEKIGDLIKFKLDVDNKLFPYELVNNFVKIRNIENKYYLLNKIEDTMFNKGKYKKNMLLIYLTYNYRISDKLDKYFNDIVISKEDVVLFIKCLEDNNIVLNEMQLINLLNGFRKKYYFDNNLSDKYRFLSNKVIGEYSKYFNDNHYFKIDEFISYYNDKYRDDFKDFIFESNFTLLNRGILFSILEGNSFLGNYFVWNKYNENFKCFKEVESRREKYILKEEKFYLEKKKFYRKYKVKINEFLAISDSCCIKYFMLKNIDSKDRGKFYELFKTLYKDNYKCLGRKKGTVRKSVENLKRDFVLELLNSYYKDRYVIMSKYIDYVSYINGSNYVNEDFFKIMVIECEKSLEMAKYVIKELRGYLYNDEVLKKKYQSLEKEVRREFGIFKIDELFLNIWSEYKYLEEEYLEIKSRIKIEEKKKVKRKSVK